MQAITVTPHGLRSHRAVGATSDTSALTHSQTHSAARGVPPAHQRQVRHAAQEHINARFAGVNRGLNDRPPAHRKARPQQHSVLELPFKCTIVPDKLMTLHDLSLSLIRWIVHVSAPSSKNCTTDGTLSPITPNFKTICWIRYHVQ